MPPAARMADPTTHGAPLAPGPGSENVLIGYMPAWRALLDQHVCPAVSITGADGVGMVMMGSPTVMINYMMACRMGDIVVEIPGLAMGPANPIIMGCPTVQIGEVGMGGAATGMGMGMAIANSSAVAVAVTNPSILSVPATPSPSIAPPSSFYKTQGAAPTGTDPQSSTTASQDPSPSDNGADNDKQNVTQIVCGLTAGSVTVSCGHGRPIKDSLLEVVSSDMGGDTLACKSSIIGTCGQHPQWQVSGYANSEKTGTADSFNIAGYLASSKALSPLPVWLGDVLPRVYTMSVSSCSGPSYAYEIHSYPNDLQEISIDLDAYHATLDPIVDGILNVLGLVIEEPKVECLKGKGNANSQWKEDPGSNKAYYSWQIALGFSPLIGAKLRLPVGSALPASLQAFGNGGFFFEAKGEINLQMNGGQIGPPTSDQGKFSASLESTVLFSVGGSAFLGAQSHPVASVEVSIQSGVDADGSGSLKGGRPSVAYKIEMGGLRGTVKFKFLFYEKIDQCTFFDQREIAKDEFFPFGDAGSNP